MANGTIIKGNGALPEIWVQNESAEDGGGRAGNSSDTKIIKIHQSSIIKDANTNSSGATVTVNSRAPEVPSIGSEEGKSYGVVGGVIVHDRSKEFNWKFN